MRDVGENKVLGSPPNPHYDHQGDNRHDNPEYPFESLNYSVLRTLWISAIREIRGRRYRIPLFDEYRISHHFYFILLPS